MTSVRHCQPAEGVYNAFGADFMKLYSRATLPAIFTILTSIAALAADSSKLQAISIDDLLPLLRSAQKPLILQVGPHILYQQAHIPGSEYMGQASTSEGLDLLRKRVAQVPKKTAIVLYCGCCPWSHCPNVNPAYDALKDLGFINVKVLYIPNNFGADWVDKKYPVERGD